MAGDYVCLPVLSSVSYYEFTEQVNESVNGLVLARCTKAYVKYYRLFQFSVAYSQFEFLFLDPPFFRVINWGNFSPQQTLDILLSQLG